MSECHPASLIYALLVIKSCVRGDGLARQGRCMLMPAVLLPVGTSRATIEMGAYAGFDFHRFDNAHGSANIETTN